MPTFTPVDHDPFAAPAKSAGGPRFIPVDHDPFAASPSRRQVSMPSYDGMGSPTGFSEMVDVPEAQPSATRDQLDDITKGVGGGLVRGLAGTVGMVTDTLPNALVAGSDWLAKKLPGVDAADYETKAAARDKAYDSSPLGRFLSTQNIQSGVEKYTGPAYEPTTRAGKIASRAAEFVPGAMIGAPANIVRNAVAFGAIPGAISEIGGQAFEGSPFETPARVAGGLAGGIGSALAMRGGTAGNMVRGAVDGATPQQLDAAEQLFNQARDMGTPISRAEAIQSVTQGATKMGDLQHTVEGMGGMKPFYADRAATNSAAARRTFDGVTPQATDPSEIGPTVGRVAQQAMRESPEGNILADTMFQAGPRVTPEQAGNTMQQELRGTFDRREGMRSALADQDYGAARNTGVPVPSGGVVGFIDREMQTAKGETQRALQAARETMYRPDGELDTSVAGLHNARAAIADQISQATRAGANNTARELGGTLSRLDDALESVPAYGQARRNFSRASEPLEAFGDTRAPGRIIERDQYGARNVMPPERAPDTVLNGGPSAARDFNSVATPQARQAFEQHVVTQVLDKASNGGADVSADAIRKALQQNEDVLRQYPGVRDRLESIAIARDGLSRLESTPIGKLAQRDQTTQKAVAALFPENPLPGSQQEISSAIETLAQRNAWAARQLVRTHAESVFNEASQRLASGPNQSGGAKFAAVFRGNDQQAANLEASVRALPNGNTTWDGFNRLLDVFEAQQFRQATGSRTAFKIPGVEDLKSGGLVNNAVQIAGGAGTKIPQKVMTAVQNWNVGKNLDELSRLLTDPAAANDFRSLANSPSGSGKALALAARLSYTAINSPAGRPRVYITQDRDGR